MARTSSPQHPPATDKDMSFEPIAIIGVGMRAPGGIENFATLWDTVINQKSHHACLATDPRFLHRFNPDNFEEMFSVTPDARTTLHGNILDENPGLDESYFGVSKRDSAGMDAQQKLLLHVAHEALEDAGFSGVADGSAFDPNTFGVFVGSSTDDYAKDPNSYPIDIYHIVRNQRAFLSGQIGHHFGLRGPCVSLDTACGGSMAAFNTACRALATGECCAAIAGGVHVMSPISGPPAVMSLKLAGFLDPRGQCKPFMIDGAGFCRAEGAGLAVMKRLSDAIHDGDRIHGVIHGIGVGNMATVSSIVRPDGPLQCLSLGRAVACSGIDPSEISFVEAHGPGTQKGDPAEVFSICSVLAKQGSRYPDNTLIIGSVKGNVGHSAAASGSMSLFKVLAMMRYQTIPPQPNFHPSMLNPRLHTFFEEHPIRISDCEQKWNAAKRIAVVSNFGGTGYAGHIIVEDSATCVQPTGSSHVSVPIFPFFVSAKDKKTLVTLAHRYADWLESEGASAALSDISYATTARREVHTYFTLVQATSQADLARQLRNDETRPIIDASSLKHLRTLAFCFSGQGGPRLDPRKSSLHGISSSFSSMVDTCFRISDSEKLVATEDVEALELFALQAGLAEMWISWGLTPVALAGHSFGEYSVLVRAGVLSIRDALKLVGIRAALIREKCTSVVSKMAALRLPLADIRGLLSQQTATQVELACINSETQVTLAGTPKDLSSFHEEVLKVHPSARWQLIDNMRAAFHSRFVEPIREEFLTACQNVDFLPSKVTVLSGLLGRTCQPGDNALTEKDYLVRHCRDTNCFGETVRDYALHNKVDRPDWIELGAHSSTIGFIPLASGQIKLPSQRKGEDGWTTTLNTLVKLRSAGHTVNFAAFHRDINPAAHHTDLPRYPFQLQPHVHPVRKANRSSSALVDKTVYPRVTSAELSSILKTHVVANVSICPSSVYMSLALAACSNERKEPPAFRVSRLLMVAPFTGLKDDWFQVRKTAPSAFEIVSKGGQVLASMQAEMCNEPRLLETLGVFKHLVSSMRSIQTLPDTNILDTRLAYDLFGQTVTYGPYCQGLRRVWITADGHQAWALSSNESHEAAHRLELEPTNLQAFSPTLIDRACQLISFLVNTSPDRGRDEIFVSTEIEHVEMTLSNLHDSVSFESYASFELSDVHGRESATAVGQVFTFDQQQRLVAVFRGVRMRRMKQRIVEHLVRQASGVPASTKHASSKPAPGRKPEETLAAPVSTPKGDDGLSNDQMRGTISAVFQTTLRIDHIPVDRKLAELGLDSLTGVEIGIKLERLVPNRQLPGDFLVQPDTTLATVFDFLGLSSLSASLPLDAAVASNLMSLPSTEKDAKVSRIEAITPVFDGPDGATSVLDRMGTNPELIQDKPGTLPLMLIHDGGGTALAYRLLGDVGRTVLGVHSPGLCEGKGIVSIRHAADQYAHFAREWLNQHSPHGSRLVIGGWSLGGTIAIALATAHPDIVAGVVLLDPPPPGTAAMKSDEAEQLIPSRTKGTSGGFSALVGTQLKMNARSFSVDADRVGGHRDLVANLRAPVYLVSATEPLNRQEAKGTTLPSAGSCSEWMLSPQRASLAEGAWSDLLGKLLVRTERIPGDHFTIFTHAHAASTTRVVQQAADALEAIAV